jgi:hypothetical protein
MNRRNFFAFIPALSAIPLLGKEIIQDKEKVTIFSPEPIPIQTEPNLPFDFNSLEIQVIDKRNGNLVGIGQVTSLTMEAPFSTYNMPSSYRKISVEGKMYSIAL